MAELRRKPQLLGFRAARKFQLVGLAALAIQVRRKVCVAKSRVLKAQYRLLAVCVAGMTVVRGPMGCAVSWLRRKDLCAANYLDQVVFVHCINALLKLQILLLELSFLCLDRRELILKRIQSLPDFKELAHER